jgi:hypothetical protein
MRTRMEKWARYRAKIVAMPGQKFPKSKRLGRPMGDSDLSYVDSLPKSKNAIRPEAAAALPSNENATPYAVYKKRKREWLIVKLALLALAVIGFTLLWFYWVQGA